MSLFCLCVVENICETCEMLLYTQQLETLANRHKRGLNFCMDWSEPIAEYIQKDSLIINITDRPESNNCELFLLPDGWCYNGQIEKQTFKTRMKVLLDISRVFVNNKRSVDLYIGQSGTDLKDFFAITLKIHELTDYLVNTIGVYGVKDGLHISIVP